MQKNKKLLAIILIAVLTVTQLPVTAMAEDVAEDEIGSAEELKAALDKVANGSWDTHTLKLTDDINYRHPILMTGGRDVTIDLNGHTLTVQPDSMAEPNINPMSNKPEIAAVYVHFGSLNITGTGELNVVAEDGVNYGVYAGEGGSCGSFGEFGDPSHDFDVTVTSTGGGTGVYATDGGTVGLYGSVSADGENAYAIECFDGGNVRIDGQITANGKSSCGVSMASYNGKSTYAGGWAHINVSGESSRGAYVNGEGTWFSIMGDVTVTGDGASGVTAGGGDPSDYTTECIVYIGGSITAPTDGVNAYDGALIQVTENVTVMDKNATAVSAVGAIVDIYGDVTSTGNDGTGISASAWDLEDPVLGAEVKIGGNITAYTPLRIESLPVEEGEHTGELSEYGIDYYIFSDGISTVRAKQGSFKVLGLYSVSIGAITGGTLTVSKTGAKPGENIMLTIIPDAGNRLKLGSLTYNDGTKDHFIGGSSFIMPAADVTVTAEFVDASVPVTNHEKAMADTAALSIGYAQGDSATSVTQNVRLTVTGAVYESSVTWTSSNTAIISNSGVVTRPSFTSGNAAVTVTASVYNSGACSTKDFDLVVLKLPQIIYTVTFDKNGGDTQASPTTKVVISGGNVGTLPMAPIRSGYTFNGWNTQANGSGTAFTAATAVNGSITVYAQWSRNSSGDSGDSSGGGGGSSDGSGGTTPPVETPKVETSQIKTSVAGNTATATTTVKAAVDSNSNATAIVSGAQVSDVISKAMEEAKKQGKGTVARVEIKVEAPVDATTVETIIPEEAIDQAAAAGIGGLAILTPVAFITFDANALSTLSKEVTGDVKITASKVEASSLSLEAQRTVGDRPVFDFSVTSGDKTISQFEGDVLVSVPYTPKDGEDTNAIVIYYINESGGLEVVSNCIYDPATGRISFSTRHFSQYAVGYNKINFKDVAGSAWCSKAVEFIAAREITTGTGDGNFSPEAKLTRGQFVVMLMKTYSIDPDLNPKDNFTDAGKTYYTEYLAAAKRLGISAGTGNNMFAPEKEITRQEMFTLLYNALKVIGRLPEGTDGKPLSSFADVENVASWAKEAMTLLVETGTISGNGGKLFPTSTTTRAEMAQVLYNLLSK